LLTRYHSKGIGRLQAVYTLKGRLISLKLLVKGLKQRCGSLPLAIETEGCRPPFYFRGIEGIDGIKIRRLPKIINVCSKKFCNSLLIEGIFC
jgi:hypothetical protein